MALMNDTVGQRLRLARENKHMQSKELAEKAGLSTGFISDIENNRRGMTVASLLALSTALDVTVEWIVRGRTTVLPCPFCNGTGKI